MLYKLLEWYCVWLVKAIFIEVTFLIEHKFLWLSLKQQCLSVGKEIQIKLVVYKTMRYVLFPSCLITDECLYPRKGRLYLNNFCDMSTFKSFMMYFWYLQIIFSKYKIVIVVLKVSMKTQRQRGSLIFFLHHLWQREHLVALLETCRGNLEFFSVFLMMLPFILMQKARPSPTWE
jgi:hypothetical protein